MTNHADLIAALRIPMNVTLPGAPELDEYDEQRKAAADALEVWKSRYEDVICERPYIVGWNNGYEFCENGDETREVPDVVSALVERKSSEVWSEATAAAYEVALKAIQDAPAGYSYHIVEHLTPQSARDWLAERDAAIRADERAKVVGEFRESPKFCDICKMEVRALAIKEKDDE